MTETAWSWLPDGALSSPPVLAAFDAAVAEWSERWFPELVLSRRRVIFDAGLPVTEPAASATRLDIRIPAPAGIALLSGAMGEDLSRVELTEHQWDLLERLRADLLTDLAHALDSALSGGGAVEPARGTDPSGAVLIELADTAGRVLATVETTRAVLALARLDALPVRPERARRPLTPLKTALASVPVRLEVRLGAVGVPLAEARRLTAGDVIVLDRNLDQALDIGAPSGGPAIACARLVDPASPLSLRLEATSSSRAPL